MKTSAAKLAQPPQTPVFQKTFHRLRPNPKVAAASSKPSKRDNTFSQSRDTREDRGSRQMKTSHSSQTLPHAGNQ
ncbi:MAG: hypothetical protein ABSF34_01165 [Verrucomicrobiota bacterium]|jgi:hypothetical protein